MRTLGCVSVAARAEGSVQAFSLPGLGLVPGSLEPVTPSAWPREGVDRRRVLRVGPGPALAPPPPVFPERRDRASLWVMGSRTSPTPASGGHVQRSLQGRHASVTCQASAGRGAAGVRGIAASAQRAWLWSHNDHLSSPAASSGPQRPSRP